MGTRDAACAAEAHGGGEKGVEGGESNGGWDSIYHFRVS